MKHVPASSIGETELRLQRLRAGIRERFNPAVPEKVEAEFPRSQTLGMLSRHPVLGVVGGAVLLFAIGPLRALSWGMRLLTAWKVLRSMT